MYCRNCGKEINEHAQVCIHCGFGVGTGNTYCPNCGASVPQGAEYCVNCGTRLKGTFHASYYGKPQKSKTVAAILAFLLGGLGIHNFYLGYTNIGIYQILLSLCCGLGYIWALVDFVRI